MMDPYKILGVPYGCDEETAKQAYRELVRKYHPDKYAGTDLADMATEKMKEINAAYEEIQADIKRRKSSGQNASASFTGSPFSESRAQNERGDDPGHALYQEVRRALRSIQLDRAAVLLDSVNPAMRTGEWYYLYGCLLEAIGRTVDALAYYDRACRMEPGNGEYETARTEARNRAARQTPHTSRTQAGEAPDELERDCGCIDPCNPLFCCGPFCCC